MVAGGTGDLLGEKSKKTPSHRGVTQRVHSLGGKSVGQRVFKDIGTVPGVDIGLEIYIQVTLSRRGSIGLRNFIPSDLCPSL